jgi:asparagine synthase (glutamine-hydrolysing)
MKLQVGLIYSDGATATNNDCLNILGEFLYRPAETAGEIADGPLAIAYRGDRITPEEEYETQPLWYGPYILTFDGRLDNRDDLTSRLGITNQQNLSDPLLVAKAYEKFGDAAFSVLIGEFAISLWCRSTRSLRLIRSVCGSRPLYYISEKGRLVWSSDFAHLVGISEVDLELDEAYAVQYLISEPDITRTPLERMRAVAPGTLIHFRENGFSSQHSLWSPTRITPLGYRNDAQYEEHCHAVLTEAVKVRLRARGNVFSELSGGFDSSAVVLLGDEILRQRNQPSSTLHTISCIYDESPTCDERSFIRTIEEHRKQESLRISEQEQEITLGLDPRDFTGLPSPLHCFPGRYKKFSTLLQQYEAKILLTGVGGDHLFWSSCDGFIFVADQIRTRNLREAHRQCKLWSRATGLPYFQLLSRSIALCSGFRDTPNTPPWLPPKHKVHIDAQVHNDSASMPHDLLPSHQAQIYLVQQLFAVTSAGYRADYRDIYVTHPYTHRPLVEFCLSVPISQFAKPGEMRSLMRRALRDVLPPRLLRRRSKAMIDETLIRALQKEWDFAQDLPRWKVCELGFVRADALLESLRKMRLGLQLPEESLVRVFSFERWLRSLDSLSKKPPSILLRRDYQMKQNAIEA